MSTNKPTMATVTPTAPTGPSSNPVLTAIDQRAEAARAWEAQQLAARAPSAEQYAADARAARVTSAPAPTSAVVAPAAPAASAPATVSSIDPTNGRSASDIDAVVAQLRDAGANTDGVEQHQAGNLIYNSADGSVIVHRAPTAGAEQAPLLDDGRSLEQEYDTVVNRANTLKSQLEEVVFDKATGKSSLRVPEGPARDSLMRQWKQSVETAQYSIGRIEALAAQRARNGDSTNGVAASAGKTFAMPNGQMATLEEAAARESYVSSAPPGQRQAYAAAWDKAQADENARIATTAIRGLRKR
jgi:hypothetical protein